MVLKTAIFDQHVGLGAQMVDFGGWNMPLQYRTGIVQEHLATRNSASIFDVSHMGRLEISGESALDFIQHVLSNNAAGLEVGESQYTMIPDENGGAIDDAYLYRFFTEKYLLVVNASNRKKVLEHFSYILPKFRDVELIDKTLETAMISLQGPLSKDILISLIESGHIPEPLKNRSSSIQIKGTTVWISRTGYTGEPLGFELFIHSNSAPAIWNILVERGACPAGLGARDTLRIEAGLPLYGHELGMDHCGKEIPIFSLSLGRVAVSFSELKGDFIGRNALYSQFQSLKNIINRNYTKIDDLPKMIFPVALTEKGVIRSGCQVIKENRIIGYITSGTMIPYQKTEGIGLSSRKLHEKVMRSIGLALLDSNVIEGDILEVDIRGKKTKAIIVPYHLRSEAPPYARSIPFDQLYLKEESCQSVSDMTRKASELIGSAVKNTAWRQQECINLIPSEQTPSAAVRLLSILDSSGRYAEHKKMKAFSEAEVFYYQGVDFITEVECLLQEELRAYFGCAQVETRLISGQMANTAFFSALCDYLNRADRKNEQRRIRSILNHHIIKGGHLSAQPMGALRDFVARDPKTERPGVVNFPVLEENPYKIDVAATCKIIADYKPELIIFGKSMILHREPVADVRSFVDSQDMDCVILYDMAHVLGLSGPFFQDPFKEGADIVTGSTHKTFWGTQRGIIASDFTRSSIKYPLWEAVERRTFPGSVSNHHPGTMVGLLMASYEMNAFKADYQKQVIINAKAFASSLKDCGLSVAGDSSISFTETHQVLLLVGYKNGPEMAKKLEDSNIIVNYQAAPEEEGFSAAGSLRMGVQEMTRFGMKEKDFQELAEIMHTVIVKNKSFKKQVTQFRKRFIEMQFCFQEKEIADQIHRVVNTIC